MSPLMRRAVFGRRKFWTNSRNRYAFKNVDTLPPGKRLTATAAPMVAAPLYDEPAYT